MDEGETASSTAAMMFRDSSLPSIPENRRYGRDNVTCSRKDMFFMTLHVVTLIAVGAIIANMASTPNDKVVPNEALVQEARVGKGRALHLHINSFSP